MEKLLWIRMLATVVASLTLAFSAHAGGEMKKVCRTEKVKGKDMEVCKTIKVHKKLEGKSVPGQKP
ncbi:hypothetical protein UFOVP456_5 [uncultured Caudovirales phage]|jgi:hypothetical protein|uniref:Uncharacterized protein n=1 Tax=uncultured Caudovirales phage TaxID=2100421 RepID=A0A6J5MA00_9CAUD|nr:hypothetical protein UFOVP456_5 [uncultured Caudovirales phage]